MEKNRLEVGLLVIVSLVCGILIGYGVTNNAWKMRHQDCYDIGIDFGRQEILDGEFWIWDDGVKIKTENKLYNVDPKRIVRKGWDVEK